MKRYFVISAIFSAVLFLCCGCTSLETLTPSDLTVAELEEKMGKAMDPNDAFSKANSYVQREMNKIDGIFYDTRLQVDLKYKKPHYLRMVTLENNQPVMAVIYNAGSAWMVNYEEKEVTEITGNDLIRFSMLYKLTNPDAKYSQLFKNVDIFKCKIRDDDNEYYKIICSAQESDDIIAIYVDAKDFLPRRISTNLTIVEKNCEINIESDTYINAYELMDGVMIPQNMTTSVSGIESTTTVFDYKLNADIPDSEFLPPVFIENKLKNRMDRFGKSDRKRGLNRQAFDD